MTPAQVELVQSTWQDVETISQQAAELFYGKLFELAPQFRERFPTDMTEQGKKLMQLIGIAVKGLTDLEAIVPAVQALGVRHLEYQTEPQDYAIVGEALLWTLGQGLGDKFTSEAEEAWAITYTVLADTMKDAAAKAAA